MKDPQTHLQIVAWVQEVITDLHAGLVEGDAQSVRVLAVVFHQLLKGSEGGAARYEETTLVQLSDAIMLHGVAISHCQRNIIYIVYFLNTSTK